MAAYLWRQVKNIWLHSTCRASRRSYLSSRTRTDAKGSRSIGRCRKHIWSWVRNAKHGISMAPSSPCVSKLGHRENERRTPIAPKKPNRRKVKAKV